MGQVRGSLQMLRSLGDRQPGLLTTRASNLMSDLEQLCKECAARSPEDEQLQTSLETLRTRYKVLLAALNIVGDVLGQADKVTTEF